MDPKGGNPKTPFPIPAKQYYEQHVTHQNGNGSTIWKMAASGFAGLFISMTVAWWTAMQNKGVPQKDMVEYVDKSFESDRKLIALQNQSQDEKIGVLMGQKDRIFDLLNIDATKHIGYDNSITEINSKIKYFADYVEEQRKAKR